MALYLVIQISAFLSKIVPRSWRYLIGTAVGDAVYTVWRTKRRVLLENMSTILGSSASDPRVRRLALKSMRNYCKYLIEFLELPTLSPDHAAIASMKVQGLDHLLQALERGKGVIIATAHFGTIELPGLRLLEFTDFSAVYDTFSPPYLDRLIQRKRLEKGINLVPANNVRAMMKVLRRGSALALLFDRPVDPARGVRVRFFGRDTFVPGGPALLTMKTDAALLPIFTIRHPDRTFEAIVFPRVIWTASGDRVRDMQAIMQRLMDALQTMVRRNPDQWYMFRPMWPDLLPAAAAAAPETATDGTSL